MWYNWYRFRSQRVVNDLLIRSFTYFQFFFSEASVKSNARIRANIVEFQYISKLAESLCSITPHYLQDFYCRLEIELHIHTHTHTQHTDALVRYDRKEAHKSKRVIRVKTLNSQIAEHMPDLVDTYEKLVILLECISNWRVWRTKNSF